MQLAYRYILRVDCVKEQMLKKGVDLNLKIQIEMYERAALAVPISRRVIVKLMMIISGYFCYLSPKRLTDLDEICYRIITQPGRTPRYLRYNGTYLRVQRSRRQNNCRF